MRATASRSPPRWGAGRGRRHFFIVHSPLTQSPETPPPVLRPRTPQTTSTPIYHPNHTLAHPAHTPHRQPPLHPPNHPPTHTHTQTHNRQPNPTGPHRNRAPAHNMFTCLRRLASIRSHTYYSCIADGLRSFRLFSYPPGRPKQPGVYIVGPRILRVSQ